MSPEEYNVYNKWGAQVVAQAKANLLQKNKVATKTLYDSISYQVDQKGGVTFYYEDYGEYVESGRKKGKMPPVGPLIQWAKIKGIEQFRNKKGRFISNEQRGWAIAMGIKKNGIKAFPFYQDAIDQSLDDLTYQLEEALAQAIESDIEALMESRQ
jgi:hypothetical protein